MRPFAGEASHAVFHWPLQNGTKVTLDKIFENGIKKWLVRIGDDPNPKGKIEGPMIDAKRFAVGLIDGRKRVGVEDWRKS